MTVIPRNVMSNPGSFWSPRCGTPFLLATPTSCAETCATPRSQLSDSSSNTDRPSSLDVAVNEGRVLRVCLSDGFPIETSAVLELYFSFFGQVISAVISGGIAFVVMASSDDAQRALGSGSEHSILGHKCMVCIETPEQQGLTPLRILDVAQLEDGSAGVSGVMVLSNVLSLLAEEDERAVLMVKKVNRLGFKSANLMREYFNRKYGAEVVKHVLMLPLTAAGGDEESSNTKQQLPPKTGFVVFRSVNAAQRVLTDNPSLNHTLRRCTFRVSGYKHNPRHFVKASLPVPQPSSTPISSSVSVARDAVLQNVCEMLNFC